VSILGTDPGFVNVEASPKPFDCGRFGPVDKLKRLMTLNRASLETPLQAFLHELSSPQGPDGETNAGREARLSRELGALVLAGDALSSASIGDLAEALCEWALDPAPERSELGQRLVFATIVEGLADSFDPAKAGLYDHLFARVIDCCRRHATGRSVDVLLSRFEIPDTEALLARKDALRSQPPFPVGERLRIKQVFVPSRVTLGADVAVTSLVLQKVERVFPAAECFVLGPAVVGELLAGTSKIARFINCPYERHGGLISRLDSWIQLVEAVRVHTQGYEPRQCLVVDPDSRLTQLGLLPLVEQTIPCFLFESRGYRRQGLETLGELTARWLDETLGAHEGEPLYPRITPDASDRVNAQAVARRMRAAAGGHITAVNLGVGGNARKRIAGRFELDLMRALLAEGAAVIIDKGIGEEVARVRAIVSELAAQGTAAIEMTADAFRQPEGVPPGQLLLCQGGLRPFTALVGSSDLYIGYDSGFQHIAAALSVPVVDVFVNAPNDLFFKRWRPYSKAPVDVVAAGSHAGDRAVIDRVIAAHRSSRIAARSVAPAGTAHN
jgi:ADP-heptose:LPS heptosyltransferase